MVVLCVFCSLYGAVAMFDDVRGSVLSLARVILGL